MMRRSFDQQLALLNREMIGMGALCEEAIALAAKALAEGDSHLAEQVFPRAAAIGQRERDIESLCLRLLLQQQPVARDLRVISAALKMITDLERIGDQAADIAEIVAQLGGRHPGAEREIRDMAQASIRMVTESVDAYVRQDVTMAEAVVAHDDLVDECFDRSKRSLIEWIAENREDGAYALDLFLISKYLERIGDHAANIAEWVIFSVTGIHRGERV